jgi:protein-serine/threonine kinase
VSTGVKVVIKHKDVSLTPHRPLKLAVNEVFALRSLNHPNIISYIDSYLLDENTLWLVMENMEGGELKEIIRNNQGGMQEDQMSRICLEVYYSTYVFLERLMFCYKHARAWHTYIARILSTGI